MNFKFLLPLCLMSVGAFAQLSDEDFNTIYSQLDEQSKEIGYIGRKEGQQNAFAEAFKRLSKNFSDDDLLYISYNGNPIMRASAGKELIDRKSNEIPGLFRTQLSNAEDIEAHQGNFTKKLKLSALIFDEVAYQKVKVERKAYYERTSTEPQLRGLKELFGTDFNSNWTSKETDSLMQVLTNIALSEDAIAPETLNEILRTNSFKSPDRLRVAAFAKKYPTCEILATLARYKNPVDLPVLKNHYPESYLAVSLFPHPTLFADLKSRLSTDFDKPDYQAAVAAYRNTQAIALLKAVFTKITTVYPEKSVQNEKIFALYSVVETSNARLYDDLLLTLEKAM